MGYKNKKRRRGKKKGGDGGGKGGEGDRRKDGRGDNQKANLAWRAVVGKNANFEAYYKAQNIVPESEWDAFMSALKDPLPSAFRVNGASIFAEKIKTELAGKFRFDREVHVREGVSRDVSPQQLPWYPHGLGWKLGCSKNELRKVKDPEVKAMHKWIVAQTDLGNLSRQEEVSMIPPLLLDVQAEDNVFDMCAAPGSKTAQLVDAMRAETNRNGGDMGKQGVVVANDVEVDRAYLLSHQMKRLGR